jgi:hypothetical protein
MTLQFHPVTQDRWSDFETLFKTRGCPHHCWCTVWRQVESKGGKASNAEKKASMKRRVDNDIPIGILGYWGKEAIAWCSIAPRNTYRPLDGHATEKNVWSWTPFMTYSEAP